MAKKTSKQTNPNLLDTSSIQPWLGTLESYQEVQNARQCALEHALEQATITDLISSSKENDEEVDDGTGFSLYEGGEDMVVRRDNLAILTIAGPLVTNDEWYNDWLGLTSYPAITRVANNLAVEESIDKVILNVATNGGSSVGLEQASAALSRLADTKELHTYTAESMHSAGYWLGVNGHTISSSAMAEMGSIGVVMVHVSIDKMLEKEGITATVFRAGEFKALGQEVEALSDTASDEFDAKLNTLYGFFKAQVANNRPGLTLATAQTWAEGRTFFGEEAVAAGLSDAVGDINELVQILQPVDNYTVSVNNNPISLSGANAMSLFSRSKPQLNLDKSGSVGTPAAGAVTPSPTPSTPDTKLDQGGEPGASATEEGAADATLAAVVDLSAKNATLSMELDMAQRGLDEANTTIAGLENAARGAVNFMQVALGHPSTDLSAVGASSLANQYAALRSDYETTFPVGRTSKGPEDATNHPKAGTGTTAGLSVGILPKDNS